MANFKDFNQTAYIKQFAADYADHQETRMRENLASRPFSKPGVSPVETMFGCALVCSLEDWQDPWSGIEEACFSNATNIPLESVIIPPMQGVYCFFQVKIGDYRVDFLVVVQLFESGTGYFAVEIDGHDFHERTRQQAARDKARDRYLQSRGIAVMRFTGSEVWNDACGCADSLLTDCYTAMDARKKDGPRGEN